MGPGLFVYQELEMIDSFAGPHEFLSNFYPSPIMDTGILYPTAEHLYQALKTLDIGQRRHIAGMKSPGRAKRAGRRLSIRADWDEIKVDLMVGILEKKFADVVLRKQLVDTYPEELVEGNTWKDHFWGVCNGVGENMLGVILMALRETYVAGIQPAKED